jgi:hypothetical protein
VRTWQVLALCTSLMLQPANADASIEEWGALPQDKRVSGASALGDSSPCVR